MTINRNVIESVQLHFEQGTNLKRSSFDSDEEFEEYTRIKDAGAKKFYEDFCDALDDWDPNCWDEFGLQPPELPSHISICIDEMDCDINDDDDVCNYIADYLSDEYDYTVCSFVYELTEDEVLVTEIEWDF